MLTMKSLLKNKKAVLMFKIGIGLVACYLAISLARQCEGFVGKKELLLLHMDGCPHCVKLTPHWEAAKAQNKTDVVMTDYERGSKKGGELCKKHNVTGFPTILLLNGGSKKEVYKGERTTGGIMSFLNSL